MSISRYLLIVIFVWGWIASPEVLMAKGGNGVSVNLCGTITDMKMDGALIDAKFDGIVTIIKCKESQGCEQLDLEAENVRLRLQIAPRWFDRKQDYFIAMAKREEDECKFDGGAIKTLPGELLQILQENARHQGKTSIELATPIIEIQGGVHRIEAGVVRVTDFTIK